jgi:hypothetical protein
VDVDQDFLLVSTSVDGSVVLHQDEFSEGAGGSFVHVDGCDYVSLLGGIKEKEEEEKEEERERVRLQVWLDDGIDDLRMDVKLTNCPP